MRGDAILSLRRESMQRSAENLTYGSKVSRRPKGETDKLIFSAFSPQKQLYGLYAVIRRKSRDYVKGVGIVIARILIAMVVDNKNVRREQYQAQQGYSSATDF